MTKNCSSKKQCGWQGSLISFDRYLADQAKKQPVCYACVKPTPATHTMPPNVRGHVYHFCDKHFAQLEQS